MPLATNFLAGSIISLLLPVLLLIAIVVWYAVAIKRVPDAKAKRPAKPGGAGTDAGPPSSNQ
jgi:hypothetical protein